MTQEYVDLLTSFFNKYFMNVYSALALFSMPGDIAGVKNEKPSILGPYIFMGGLTIIHDNNK